MKMTRAVSAAVFRSDRHPTSETDDVSYGGTVRQKSSKRSGVRKMFRDCSLSNIISTHYIAPVKKKKKQSKSPLDQQRNERHIIKGLE